MGGYGSSGLMYHKLTPAYALDPKDDRSFYVMPSTDDTRLPWLDAAYDEAVLDNQASDEVQAMTRYIDYLMSRQWTQKRASYKSKPVNNRIWSLFWEMVALLTDLRPFAETKAATEQGDQGEMAAMFAKTAAAITTLTRSWWMESDADLDLTQIIIYAIFCTGFGKLEWNPRARNGWGDFDLLPLSPTNCLPLKPIGYNLDDAQGIIYRTPKPLNFFRERYAKWKIGATGVGSQVQPDLELSTYSRPAKLPSNMNQWQFDQLSTGMQRKMAGDPRLFGSAFPMAWYKEFWINDQSVNETGQTVVMGDPASNWCYRVEPDQPLYPRKRLIVQGGRVILYDGPNPYWHGHYPFAVLRMNVVPWSFHGLSDLKPLCDLQDVGNQILAGVLDMVKRAVNPGFVAPKKSFSDAQWNEMDWSMPGYKAAYSPLGGQAPQFAPQPQLPAFVLQVLQGIDRAMDTSSGIATINEVIRKRQIPSAETIEQARQTQQTPIRLKGRMIEQCLRQLGTQNISNIFQFYNQARTVFTVGENAQAMLPFRWDPGEYIPHALEPATMARNFVFTIPPGSLLGVNKLEQSAMYFNLRKMKDISRATLLKVLDIGVDPQKEQVALDKETAEQVKQMMAAKMLSGGAAAGGAQ